MQLFSRTEADKSGLKRCSDKFPHDFHTLGVRYSLCAPKWRTRSEFRDFTLVTHRLLAVLLLSTLITRATLPDFI